MTPERGSGPVGQTEPQEKQLPEAWSLKSSTSHAIRVTSFRHIGEILRAVIVEARAA